VMRKPYFVSKGWGVFFEINNNHFYNLNQEFNDLKELVA